MAKAAKPSAARKSKEHLRTPNKESGSTKSDATASEPASDLPEGVLLSDEPLLGHIYRSYRDGVCTVIGFGREIETSEEVVAFLDTTGKHYVMKTRNWMLSSRHAPDRKRFTDLGERP